jgi:mono/diheme cytochrome c family protein
MKPRTLLLIAIACFAVAAVIFVVGMWSVGLRIRHFRMMRGPGYRGPSFMMRRPMQRPPGVLYQYQSNGERIYHSGFAEAGNRIAFTGGPMWFRMHAGSCVDCHGPLGRGGTTVMMTQITAPDIRYGVLTGKQHAAGEEAGHHHEPYTDATIKRAITQGVEPDGHRLDPTMPRFQISDQDLNDLINYLKVLGGG